MSTIPTSSNVMLGGTMLAFFTTCLVITFQAPLIWWIIPVALAVLVVTIATLRVRRHRRMRTAMQGARL